MKYFLCYLFFFGITIGVSSAVEEQSPEDTFNDAFRRIYMQTASYDVPKALIEADSLYRTAETNIHKVRALMLVSNMHYRMAARDSSIHYASLAGKLAEADRMIDWQARVYGTLSTQYRETGLLKEGKKYLQKGLEISEKIESPNMANQFAGQVYQEKGYYAIAEKQFHEAIAFLKKGATFFENIPESPDRHIFLALNGQMLGDCYLELQLIDSARYHYLTALAFEARGSGEETPTKGYIYTGLGALSLRKGDTAQSRVYLLQALEIAETTGFPNLKGRVYKGLSDYYKAVGEIDEYFVYNQKYLDIMGENMDKNQYVADDFLSRAQQQLQELTTLQKTMTGIAVILFLGASLGIFFYSRKQRRDKKRFLQLIDQLNKKQQQPSTVSATHHQSAKDKEIMSDAVKQELLQKLEDFESSAQFTDKNISLSVLAGKFHTNTKYLSHVVNKYRERDFNTYINELRIDYIIMMLKTDPQYLQYKISYLAEDSGFSSHSKFATVFKQVTGLAPSTFIASMKEYQRKVTEDDGAEVTILAQS